MNTPDSSTASLVRLNTRSAFVRRLLFAAGAFASLSTPSIGEDWIIDDDGGTGVDFTQIQPAVIWASAGDTLVIRAGTYSGFVIDGKALTLAGAGATQVRVNGSVTVSDVTSGAGVHLEGIHFQDSSPALRLQDDTVPVWLSDCDLSGLQGEQGQWGGHAAIVVGCPEVGFIRCTIEGGRGGDGFDFGIGQDGSDGGYGVSTGSSNLQFFECGIVGGAGGSAGDSDAAGGSGRAAVRASNESRVFVSRSSLGGGAHGDIFPDQCAPTIFLDGSSVMRHFESTFTNSSCAPVAPSVPGADTTAFCFGGYHACPCGNNGFGGAGCGDSLGGVGGELHLSGSASVSADTITLLHQGLPAGRPLLYFQGAFVPGGGSGIPLGDGLLCAGGSNIRLATRISSGGEDAYGFAVSTDPPVSVRGQIPAGGATRYYQVWYREPNAQCSAGNFNFSNGLLVPWTL